MPELCEQLVTAYARQQQLYEQMLEMVGRQERLMTARPMPAAVSELCESVGEIMGRIAALEKQIEPTKGLWEQQDRRDPDGRLDAVLSTIQGLIERIAESQGRVRRQLLQYVCDEQAETQAARAGVQARRAALRYGASGGQLG